MAGPGGPGGAVQCSVMHVGYKRVLRVDLSSMGVVGIVSGLRKQPHAYHGVRCKGEHT